MAIALPARLALLREPLNSDDHQYMAAAQALLDGRHPVQSGLKPTTEGGRINHHWLRLGLVVPVAGAIRVLGSGAAAYYALPFGFSILAIALVFFTLHAYAGTAVAFFAGLVQVFNPFEVLRASNLLTNLATAMLIFGYVLLLGAIRKRPRSWAADLTVGGAGGLLLAWAYLMRQGAPAAAVPCFVVCLFLKRYRRPVLIGLVVLAAVGLGEQLLLMAHGGEFAYRAHNISNSINNYRRFLPHSATFGQYVLRYPHAVRSMTGSTLLVGAFYLAVLAHVYVLVFGERLALRLLAACGLFNLLLFTFILFAPLAEGYVTMPAKFRYVQLFLMTSLVCVAWSLWHLASFRARPLLDGALRAREEKQGAAGKAPLRRRMRAGVAWGVTIACFLVFFVPCVRATLRLRGAPLLHPHNDYMSILLAVDAVMEENGIDAAEVVGTRRGISAIRMFRRLPGGKRLSWRSHSAEECARLIEADAVLLFVTDFQRERFSLRYIQDEQKKDQKAASLDRLEQLARERLLPVRSNRRFLLAKSSELQ
jgi:hypothetical protein